MQCDVKEEIDEKVERLSRLMAAEGLAGVLINTQPNFAWLSAGGSNGVDASREAGVGSLLIRSDGRKFVLANRIELTRLLAEQLNGQEYEPIDFGWEEEKANPFLAADVARSLLDQQLSLGSDFPLGSAVHVVDQAIARARYKLTPAETDRFRLLGREAGEAIGQMARSLTLGLSEREVARRAIDSLGRIGADSVVTLVAADERLRRFRHPTPTNLRWDQTLMVAVCARRHGLIASLTRIVCAGKVPDDLSQRMRASAGVMGRLLAATKPGASGAELYEIAARAYNDAGFPGEEHLHHQGGATGYRTRDWVAHPACTERVIERQAFAWNPSITGSKVEETCIASHERVEIITTTLDWPSILVTVEGGCEYRLPDVLSL
ncbi:MAG: chorismate mutase / prephenate dehydratase [Blastocatellia bacterium]|jgi:Xaa-Pro aminopeptidase|nr:chorismate mutase / prephenate dehydratase [Blastocatellia bacterium]